MIKLILTKNNKSPGRVLSQNWGNESPRSFGALKETIFNFNADYGTPLEIFNALTRVRNILIESSCRIDAINKFNKK